MTTIFALSSYYVLHQHRALFDTVVLYGQQKQRDVTKQTKHTLLARWCQNNKKELQKLGDGVYQLAKDSDNLVEVIVEGDKVNLIAKRST